ncbi:70 kDa peptidyl-prolyl isomerase [Bienertia sinuspersici]
MAIVNDSSGSQMANNEYMDEDDDEPGEVIESAPPLRVGEEREIRDSGIKKKLLKRGIRWETPNYGDEVTVHYVGTLLNGTNFDSTRDNDQPFTFKLGYGEVAKGLDMGIMTMKKGEVALFTLPPEMVNVDGGSDKVASDPVVQFEVELISWIIVVDVCKDGGIIKRILEKGQNDNQPSELDEVLVKYQIMLADGTIVAKTPEGGVQFYIKDGHLLPALAKAIKTMKVGEKANLIVQPQYGFGDLGKEIGTTLSSIPPNSALDINLELVSFKRVMDVCSDSKVIKKILEEGESLVAADEGAAEKAPWELNSEERIMTAGKIKEEGNVLFKSGKYQRAGKKYDKVLTSLIICVYIDRCYMFLDTWMIELQAADYVSEDISFGDEQQKQVKALRVQCWLNGAACSLKLDDFKEAIKLCSKVLVIESYNIKALYRRTQAFMENADLDLAELDIKKALEVDPGNREVKLILKTLKQRQAERNQQDAKLYANMFSSSTRDSMVANKKMKVEGKNSDGYGKC